MRAVMPALMKCALFAAQSLKLSPIVGCLLLILLGCGPHTPFADAQARASYLASLRGPPGVPGEASDRLTEKLAGSGDSTGKEADVGRVSHVDRARGRNLPPAELPELAEGESILVVLAAGQKALLRRSSGKYALELPDADRRRGFLGTPTASGKGPFEAIVWPDGFPYLFYVECRELSPNDSSKDLCLVRHDPRPADEQKKAPSWASLPNTWNAYFLKPRLTAGSKPAPAEIKLKLTQGDDEPTFVDLTRENGLLAVVYVEGESAPFFDSRKHSRQLELFQAKPGATQILFGIMSEPDETWLVAFPAPSSKKLSTS